MFYDKLPMYLEKDEWNMYDNEKDCAVPTAMCPAEGIKEFNEIRLGIVSGYIQGEVPTDYDPYIPIEKFVEMRKSIGYNDEQIEKELPLVYNHKIIAAYKSQ